MRNYVFMFTILLFLNLNATSREATKTNDSKYIYNIINQLIIKQFNECGLKPDNVLIRNCLEDKITKISNDNIKRLKQFKKNFKKVINLKDTDELKISRLSDYKFLSKNLKIELDYITGYRYEPVCKTYAWAEFQLGGGFDTGILRCKLKYNLEFNLKIKEILQNLI